MDRVNPEMHYATPWQYVESNNSNLIHLETVETGAHIATVNGGNRHERLANAAHIIRCVNYYEAQARDDRAVLRVALMATEATLALCAGKNLPAYVEGRRRETLAIVKRALRETD